MSTVSRTTTYTLVSSTLTGASGVHGAATFEFDDAAPFEITVDLGWDSKGRRIVWTFARDLLADGLTRSVGMQDVACRTEGAWYYITLSSPEGRAVFKVIAEMVRAFLVDAEDLVPYGSEAIDFDAEIAALLKDGAR